ncbi:MAG: domain S-box protein [Bacteroidetes bacterium]|nr:domain S-box protein [Bacteroidota bacterium]
METEPGHGTTFKLYFGAPPRHIEAERKPDEPEEIRGGTETILLVEDEERLLIPIKSLLEEQGYQVVVARDGVQAVEVYIRNMDKIDLVLSDIGLPKQDGWAAFLQMRENNPGVKAVLASGNFDLSKKTEMIERGVRR